MKLELLLDGLGFAEGPLWHPDGYLIFSDLVKNKMIKYDNGKEETFLENSGLNGIADAYCNEQVGSNGIAIGKDGGLLFCQHGNHAISKLITGGNIETIVNSYQGKRLNSPNDLAIGADGSIYFTDPPYGMKGQELLPHVAQPISGVYRWANQTLELLTDEYLFPNGICFSPDQKHLYIGSNHEGEFIKKYDVIDGRLQNGRVFVEKNSDGLKTDKEGNLYLATEKGILIISPEGKTIKHIPTPEMATNLCFHGNEIYITTQHHLYWGLLN